MDKRIKTVWVLSILTLLIIFLCQGVWLYLQYDNSCKAVALRMETVCDSAFNLEYAQRYNLMRKQSDGKDAKMVVWSGLLDESKNRNGRRGFLYGTCDIETKSALTDTVWLRGLTDDNSSKMVYYWSMSKKRKFQTAVIDSMLLDKGLDKMKNQHYVKTDSVFYPAQYTVGGFLHKHLHVIFSTNAICKQALSFDVDIPMEWAFFAIMWPVVVSLLVLSILSACLIYQIRTIMIQKRIDALRREFLKNMIYEMKQPAADNGASGEQPIRIGHTDFYYHQNELRCANERVIITSRQAEILKTLCDNLNKEVSRQQLLNDVWGDDSYANSLALNVQMTYLRRALAGDDSIGIETVIKKGYTLHG